MREGGPPASRPVPDLEVAGAPRRRDVRDFDPATWDFRVGGLVEAPRASPGPVLALPRVRSPPTSTASPRWSTFDNRWEGVAFRAMLEKGGPQPAARHVMASVHVGRARYGYSANLPAGRPGPPDVLLSYSPRRRAPRPRSRGATAPGRPPPLRVEERRSGCADCISWRRTAPGTGNAAGYHMRGDPFAEERFGVHRQGMAAAPSARRRRRRGGRISRARPGDVPAPAQPHFPRPRHGGRADEARGPRQHRHRPAAHAGRPFRAAVPAILARRRPVGGQSGRLLRHHGGAGGLDHRGIPDLLARGAEGAGAVDQRHGRAHDRHHGVGPAAALPMDPRVDPGHARPPPAGLRALSAVPGRPPRRGPKRWRRIRRVPTSSSSPSTPCARIISAPTAGPRRSHRTWTASPAKARCSRARLAASPWTIPSVASMLTGPSDHPPRRRLAAGRRA